MGRTKTPAGGLRNEAQAGLCGTNPEASDVTYRSKSAIVEEVLVNTVSDQHSKIFSSRPPSHFGHNVEGSRMPCFPGAGWAKVAISVLNHELEGYSLHGRPERTEFAFRISANPNEHEVYNVGDIDIVRGLIEGVLSEDKRLGCGPKSSRSIIDLFIVSEIIIRINGFVFILTASEIAGGHVCAPSLTHMILTPVGAIQVDMNKPSVGSDIAHVQHGVVGEAIGHIGSPGIHVVGATAEIDDIELLCRRMVLVLKALKNRVAYLGWAKSLAEGYAEAFLTEIGKAATVVA